MVTLPCSVAIVLIFLVQYFFWPCISVSFSLALYLLLCSSAAKRGMGGCGGVNLSSFCSSFAFDANRQL